MDRTTRQARIAWVMGALLSSATVVCAGVSESINALLKDPFLKSAEVGVKVVRLGKTPDQTQTIFEHNASTPLIPASNLKLITTAAMLDKFGKDFHFKTRLLQKGKTLAIIGDGDPTLGDAVLLKKMNLASTSLIEQWADALMSHGVTSFENIIFDDSIFDQQFQHPNWPTDQLHKWYGAGVGGLNFNTNCLDFYLTVKGMGQIVDYRIDPQTSYAQIANNCVQGNKNEIWLSRALSGDKIDLKGQTDASNTEAISITVSDPSFYSATVIKETMARKGITISGEVTRDRTIRQSMQGWQELLVHETPITAALARANKDSMNMYAEAMCKRLGAAESNQPGSWENGTAAVGHFLDSLGIPASQYNLDDGCGLSKKNKISPNTFVSVLVHEFYSPDREVFLNSLAVAGVDGTFKKRFDGTPLHNRVFGKSGSVSRVSTLTGFVNGRDGNWYAFSILFNDIGAGTGIGAHALQEKIVLCIDK